MADILRGLFPLSSELCATGGYIQPQKYSHSIKEIHLFWFQILFLPPFQTQKAKSKIKQIYILNTSLHWNARLS